MANDEGGKSVGQSNLQKEQIPGHQERDAWDHAHRQDDQADFVQFVARHCVGRGKPDDEPDTGLCYCHKETVEDRLQEVVSAEDRHVILQSRHEVEYAFAGINDIHIVFKACQHHPEEGKDRKQEHGVNQHIPKQSTDERMLQPGSLGCLYVLAEFVSRRN